MSVEFVQEENYFGVFSYKGSEKELIIGVTEMLYEYIKENIKYMCDFDSERGTGVINVILNDKRNGFSMRYNIDVLLDIEKKSAVFSFDDSPMQSMVAFFGEV